MVGALIISSSLIGFCKYVYLPWSRHRKYEMQEQFGDQYFKDNDINKNLSEITH